MNGRHDEGIDKLNEPSDAEIQAGRAVLLKYTLPDCLKPEFDGMTAWEIVKKILIASDKAKGQE